MCSCVLLSPGRFGPLRAEVVVGFRRVRLVQALLSSPSSAGLVPFSVGLRFSFPLPFQGCPFWARFHVLVFARSLFFCVPLFASWLSNFHLIVIFTSSPHLHFPSSSFSSHCRDLNVPPSCGRVCVWTIWKDVKLLTCLMMCFNGFPIWHCLFGFFIWFSNKSRGARPSVTTLPNEAMSLKGKQLGTPSCVPADSF